MYIVLLQFSDCFNVNYFVAGYLDYTVLYFPSSGDAKCNVTLFNKQGEFISNDERCMGTLKVSNAILWWPINSGYQPVGYLYTLKVSAMIKTINTFSLLPCLIVLTH